MKVSLESLARVIRSKNAGPYQLTLDVIFREKSGYERVRDSGQITEALVSRLYGVPEELVDGIVWFEPALALKITLRRPVPSGHPGDTDVYGAQQYAPLLGLTLELS